MRFGKLVNGYMEIAPAIIKHNGAVVLTNSVEEYAAMGYKPLVATEPVGENYTWFDDGNNYVQVWVEPVAQNDNAGASDLEKEDMQAALAVLDITPE